jgi:Cdc6-like AAA superfamily ATPase
MKSNRFETLKAIDCVIRNLGDNRPLPRKRKIDHIVSPTVNPDLINFIPVGKEEQFHALYQILQQGLVGAEGAGSKKELRNVSSLLFGPRGSGKTLVLDACISALNQSNHVDGKPKFRVVRLNGIAMKGHDVTVVLRVSEFLSSREMYFSF